MGRVGGAAFNPMDAPGELTYGGAGTPTGYVDLLAGLSGAGSGGTVLSTSAGAGGWQAGWTNGTPADGSGGPTWASGAWLKADFGAGVRVARFRYTGDAWQNNGPDTDLILESSDDNATWVTRWQMSVDGPAWSTVLDTGTGWAFGDYRDTGLIQLPQPITARYWRIRGLGGGGGNPWGIGIVQLDRVATVGAGNLTVLDPPPTAPRVLTYDGPAGAPKWAAPQAAEADLGATAGIAVNDASATLVATKAEHDATRAKVNALITKLEAAGILAP